MICDPKTMTIPSVDGIFNVIESLGGIIYVRHGAEALEKMNKNGVDDEELTKLVEENGSNGYWVEIDVGDICCWNYRESLSECIKSVFEMFINDLNERLRKS